MPSTLVTGGSRGIGLAIAERLARSGRDVVVVARGQGDKLQEAVEETTRAGKGSLRFHAADLADIAAIPALAKTLRKNFGAINALVNNAGTGNANLLAMMSDSEIERVMTLNLLSPLVLTKHIVRGMMADGEGRIVNIASIAASSGFKGLSVYAATKAGLVGFTRSLARELGPLNITVNAVAPGFVDTELTRDMTADHRNQLVRRSPLRRLAEASDVACAVEFLLGEGGRHLTGVVLPVDAGASA